ALLKQAGVARSGASDPRVRPRDPCLAIHPAGARSGPDRPIHSGGDVGMIEAPAEGSGLLAEEVAARIQATRLGPGVTRAEIEQLLAECVEHGFHAAVVSPIWIPLAVRSLQG